MKEASTVLLSGGSAGGVAAYIWADYLKSQLDIAKTSYFVAPDSGFAINYANYATKTYLIDIQFKNLYTVAN